MKKEQPRITREGNLRRWKAAAKDNRTMDCIDGKLVFRIYHLRTGIWEEVCSISEISLVNQLIAKRYPARKK